MEVIQQNPQTAEQRIRELEAQLAQLQQARAEVPRVVVAPTNTESFAVRVRKTLKRIFDNTMTCFLLSWFIGILFSIVEVLVPGVCNTVYWFCTITFNIATGPLLVMYKFTTPVLEVINPPPPPPEKNVYEKFVDQFSWLELYLPVSLVKFVLSLTMLDMANIVFGLFLAYLLYSFNINFVFPSAMKVYRTKSNKLNFMGESMIEGSYLTNAILPPFQFCIWNINKDTSMKTYLGHAIRVKNGLFAVPLHVMQHLDDCVGYSKNESSEVYCLPTPSVINSNINRDLGFVRLQEKIFSKMGVTVAKLADSVEAKMVQCTGFDGKLVRASSGAVVEVGHMPTQVEYTGSTVGGYSGSAYYINNVVFGMHQGTSAGMNLGVPGFLIAEELKYIEIGESSEDFVRMTGASRVSPKERLRSLVDDVYVPNKRRNHTMDVVETLVDAVKESKVNGVGHNPTLPQVSFDVKCPLTEKVDHMFEAMLRMHELNSSVEHRVSTLENQFDNLMALVSNLKETVSKNCVMKPGEKNIRPEMIGKEKVEKEDFQEEAAPKASPNKKRIICNKCGVEPKTSIFKHLKTQHPIKGETAFDIDSKKVVKTKAFLEKRKGSQKKTSSPSKKALNLKATQTDFMVQFLENQKKMSESLKNVGGFLEKLQKTVNGLNQVPMRK